MSELSSFMNAIKAEAAKIDAIMKADIASLESSVDPLLIEVLEYGLLSGGKRVRPLLVVLSARLCGYQPDDVYDLARAFEYLHVATLFHDDVIDNADLRRGKPSLNKRYGRIVAILAGDFLHARSMEIVGSMSGSKGLEIFCQATAGMVDGEFMQLRNSSRVDLSKPEYYSAIMGKTGLLIAAACEIGALFGAGTSEQQIALREYGTGLGCAFQMVDDILDYSGQEASTGKAVGNDLIEGKITLPLLLTLASASGDDRTQLLDIIMDVKRREVEFERVLGYINKYDGLQATRKHAEDEVSKAIAQLDCFTAPEVKPSLTILRTLAQYVLSRNT